LGYFGVGDSLILKLFLSMKKINLLIGIFILGIFALIILSGNVDKFVTSDLDEDFKIQDNQEERKVSLIIDNGKEPPMISDSEFRAGITVFDLLQEEAKSLNMILETENYDIGILVKAIGDTENGQDGKYWFYYVNGEMPQVSVDKKEVNPGDKIEFRFEKSPF
jgi:hypothetical protein